MPERDKDVGPDSNPIEADGNISMGFGLDLCSEMKWEIMNGFGDKQIGKWWREMASLYREKWSGREKRACAVENSDRAWQLTAQELGNDLNH